MKVNRKELVNILSLLRPGLNKDEKGKETCHFIFFTDQITVYNDKMCIIHPFESEDEFSVKGEEFYRLINGITDEEIDLIVKNNKIKIKSKTTSSQLALLEEDQKNVSEKIISLEENYSKWIKLPSNFIEALSLCHFSASSDLTMGANSCVQIVGDKCYATDNVRASYYTMDETMKNFNIPAKTVIELIKFPITEYCYNKKWVSFKTDDDVIFSCATVGEIFDCSQIDRLFLELENLPVVELPDELKQTIIEVLILASDDVRTGKRIFISLNKNSLLVRAENELGFVEKTIEIDYEEEPLEMGINSNFITQILDRSYEMYIGEKSLYFAVPNFFHIMMKAESFVSKEK